MHFKNYINLVQLHYTLLYRANTHSPAIHVCNTSKSSFKMRKSPSLLKSNVPFLSVIPNSLAG